MPGDRVAATASDVLAAVLTREPDWQALPPTTPPALFRVLRRCLERDPKRRPHDIADARLYRIKLEGGAPLHLAHARVP